MKRKSQKKKKYVGGITWSSLKYNMPELQNKFISLMEKENLEKNSK